MKILHIVRALDVGGLERVVLDLVEGGRTLGVESHIACLHHAGTWGEGRSDLTVLAGRSKLAKGLSLAKLARSLKVDVLHSHNPEPHLVAVLARCITGLPVVNTKHGRNCPERWKWRLQNFWLNRCSAKIVAVSRDIERVALGPERTPCGKVCLINNGIAVELFDQGRHGRHGNKNVGGQERLTIGTVGRLRPEKNYLMLIRAFALMRKQLARSAPSSLRCRLLFVGDGPQRGILEAEATRLGIQDQCEFVGHQADVGAWLQQMDVFCLSSRTEGTSITLLEACAAGVPAVVTNVGGNGEIIQDRHSGIVVPEGDEKAFAQALCALVENLELRGSMGTNARAWVAEHYSLESMVKAYTRVYGDSAKRVGVDC